MAGDWIKVEKATARKVEILQIANALEIHPDHAFGLCVRFWAWCDDNLTNGHVNVTQVSTVDVTVGHAGFADALLSVGWLKARDGSLLVPNFDRHLSESAKNRALSGERKRKQRSRGQRDKSVTREEKRREDTDTSKDVSVTPIPLQELVDAWNAADGNSKCTTMEPDRQRKALARLKDRAWNWREALAKFPLRLVVSDPGGWKPDFDWFLQPASVRKILEGKYDWEKKPDKQQSLLSSRVGPGQRYTPDE